VSRETARGADRTDPDDERWMRRAIRLARRGLGRTRPNPAVGSVVVRDGEVVGSGWHRRAGGPHAEIHALRAAGERARGATLYVTLEPCCHVGRTGPCVEAVLAAGVGRVVVGSIDPNPRVRGGGVAILRRRKVPVRVGVLGDECRRMNEAFEKHVTTGAPFVLLKLATTLDGRIATRSGDSRWITGDAARREVHEIRNHVDAVIVGSGTVVADDPELTCRIAGGRDPLRVVLDGRLRSPLRSRVFSGAAPTRLYTADVGSPAAARLRERGVDVRRGGGDRPGTLGRVLADLGGEGFLGVLLEGGGTLAARALREGLVDRVILHLAPKLVGGDGRAALASLGVRRIAEALALEEIVVGRIGDDLRIEGRPAGGTRKTHARLPRSKAKR
jgi:diaminohydroxyphosphoribosylaminopyrimidine deaminase / 5-amino-6-(5-phosphoribosylamino)uracil reductase